MTKKDRKALQRVQRLNVHFSSEKQDWATPWPVVLAAAKRWAVDLLNPKGPSFGLDAACTNDNQKAVHGSSIHRGDALNCSWALKCNNHPTVWMNPPYGAEIVEWVKKANKEATENGVKIVALLPARTDTKWFHDDILGCRRAEVRYLRGRIKFGGASAGAPFPSMLVVYRPGGLY